MTDLLFDIPRTFGALLLGGLFATLLSGFLAVQIVVYFKTYPEDKLRNKSLVGTLWLLDIFHTICMWVALWNGLIVNFGNPFVLLIIPWTVSMSVFITGVTNFLFHLFWVHRIFQLSKRNYWLTISIMIFVCLRVISAFVSTAFMLKLGTVIRFREMIGWNFTLGLSLSSLVDVMVTISLFILLQKSRTGADPINKIINSLIWYSFETGLLTCAGTVSTLLCWIIFPNYLIFFGIHYCLNKLYANSLLVNLNLRRHIRQTHSSFSIHNTADMRVRQPEPPKSGQFSDSSLVMESETKQVPMNQVRVNVERTIHFGS